MKEKTVLVTKIEELTNYSWLSYEITPEGDIEFVCNDETIAEAAKAWKMTPAAVKAIKESFDYFAETLVENLKSDLEDLWKAANEKAG